MKEAWPNVWKSQCGELHPEVAETIGFRESLCCGLESNGRTLLAALPPEQREFAMEVLTKFEPKENDALPKPEKVKRKPDRKNG